MQDKTLWLDALNDEDIRKNIAYNIMRFGTTKTVDAIYQNPNFANCRTGNAARDRKAIRSAIQVCNPKNKDRFNTQKYGGAVADALRDQYEFMVAEHVPNLEQSLKRMQQVDDMAVEAETIEDPKRLKLRQQIHDKHRSALSSLAGTVQFHRRPADEADADSAQSHNPMTMSPLQPHHVRLLNLIPYDKTGVRVNVQAPRGSAKTTCCAVWYPLWRICFKAFQLAEGVPDEQFILIISRNQPMAKKILRDIKNLMNNKKIVADFGVLRGPVWKTVERETANRVTLLPLGRNQSPRGPLVDGKRPSLVLVDDLEDPKRCLNPDLREEDWDWVFSDVMFTSDIGAHLY